MEEREKQIRQRLKDEFDYYAAKCLKIRTKSGDTLSFALNRAQMYVHELVEKQKIATGKVRAIILKGRQQGISTYIGGRIYHKVTHRRGVRAFILTHEKEATENLFGMSERYHNNCPELVRPMTGVNNAKELYFSGLDSGYKVGTAGNKGVGRSSTIQYLHGSEVAMWPNAEEHSKGIIQAVPNEPGTEIFLESTARGIGNYYHEQWQLAESGESDYIPIFVPWHWQTEYQREMTEDFVPREDEAELIEFYNLTAPQLLWRRAKILEFSSSGADGAKAFQQEYPNNATEAFQMSGDDTLIPPALVLRARKHKAEASGALIVGCDPARFGRDRTSIIYRRGRKAYNLKSYEKKSTMEVAGILHKIIVTDKPDKVCVDVGGLGAGVVDRLIELGFKDIVVEVNAGETPLDQDLYLNKRAEMWGETKRWLDNGSVEIPDVDSLHADLCSTKYSYDSLTRLVIEKKELMKKRGLRSPDEADALCLTFALPFSAIQKTKNSSESVAAQMMAKQNALWRVKANR